VRDVLKGALSRTWRLELLPPGQLGRVAVGGEDQLVTEGLQTLISSSLTLIGTAVILVALDPGLALVTFLCFPVLLVSSILFRLASAGAYRLTREKIAAVTAYLQETLSGVRVVRAFGQEHRHRTRFAQLNDEHREYIVRRLATYVRPSQVRREMRERFGIALTRPAIDHYDPTLSPACGRHLSVS